MIISRIDGGLGNQMFQYAYGLYLARRHQTPLILDTNSYRAAPQHGYLLDRFCIQAEVAGASVIGKIPVRYRGREPDSLHASRNWLDKLGVGCLRRHKESPFGFQSKHLTVSNHRYLVGYWQSERFFPGMHDELKSHFKPRNSLSAESQIVADKIRSTNSAVLHVRRGDYLTNSKASQIYHHLGLDYYINSLNDWAASHESPEVFVFSNDMAWCRQNIKLPWKTHWVDHNGLATAHEDLVLMSQAACCVIANSTFSWWAAWLNDRPDHIVYAPPFWFQPKTMDDSSILCDHWRVIAPTGKVAA